MKLKIIYLLALLNMTAVSEVFSQNLNLADLIQLQRTKDTLTIDSALRGKWHKENPNFISWLEGSSTFSSNNEIDVERTHIWSDNIPPSETVEFFIFHVNDVIGSYTVFSTASKNTYSRMLREAKKLSKSSFSKKSDRHIFELDTISMAFVKNEGVYIGNKESYTVALTDLKWVERGK